MHLSEIICVQLERVKLGFNNLSNYLQKNECGVLQLILFSPISSYGKAIPYAENHANEWKTGFHMENRLFREY